MNRRIRAPLIWPPNRNDTSKLTSSDFSAGPSVACTARIARPMRWAAWNMVGAGDRHDALAGLGEDVELAEGRDVVEAGIGAGVGDHNQPVPYQHAATIGHFLSSNRPNYRQQN